METKARACRDDVCGKGDELRAFFLLRLRRGCGRGGREPGLCVLARGVHLQQDVESGAVRGHGLGGRHRLDGVYVDNG